jgi:hypothetical protein
VVEEVFPEKMLYQILTAMVRILLYAKHVKKLCIIEMEIS